MLTAFTSLAMIALAIHTKRIYANAMEAMLSETRNPRGPGTPVDLNARTRSEGASLLPSP